MSALWRSEGRKAGYVIYVMFLYTVCIRMLNGLDIDMQLILTSPHTHFILCPYPCCYPFAARMNQAFSLLHNSKPPLSILQIIKDQLNKSIEN